ncbi:DUF3987 domain-containing protein [Streptomyces sp. NPDC087850]|uniref:DUF3987 domain-containing protein n=1 Tax=Streptomyces sp. NPDC087850 TaxID=3365809 RepID=UPI0038271CD5
MAVKEKTRFEQMAYGPLGAAVKKAMPHTDADPIGVWAASLSLYSAALNGHVTQPSGRPVGVWTVLVGRSLLGCKGFALATSKAILADSVGGFIDSKTRGGISSGPSLVNLLYEEVESSRTSESGEDGRLLWITEEWVEVLSRTKRCPTFPSNFRTAWDGGMVMNTIKGAGGKREEQRVDNPLLVFHAHIQPGVWGTSLNSRDALGGTYNRLIMVEVEGTDKLDPFEKTPLERITPSKALKDAYVWARKEPRSMEFSQPSAALFRAIRSQYRDSMSEMPESTSCYMERAAEHVMRVASVLTATQKRTVIGVEAVQAARAFVDYGIDTVKKLVAESASNMPGRKILPLDERIRNKIAAAGGAMRSSALHGSLGGRVSAAQIQAVAEEMPDIERVVLPSTRPGSRPVEYRIIEPEESAVAVPDTPPVPVPTQRAPRKRTPRKTAPKTAPEEREEGPGDPPGPGLPANPVRKRAARKRAVPKKKEVDV